MDCKAVNLVTAEKNAISFDTRQYGNSYGYARDVLGIKLRFASSQLLNEGVLIGGDWYFRLARSSVRKPIKKQ